MLYDISDSVINISLSDTFVKCFFQQIPPIIPDEEYYVNENGQDGR